MSATQKKKLLQQIFAEMAQGNSRPLVENMADDFSWTVTGSTKWSRTYAGKQAVLNDLFATLRSHLADRIKTIAQRFIAEDDLVVVEAHGSNTTKSGEAYNNKYCFVFRVVDGKLKDVTEYTDTLLIAKVLGD